MAVGIPLMVAAGLGIPLLWAWRTQRWRETGFTLINMGAVIRWSLIAGVFTAGLGIALIGRIAIPSDLPLQMIVGAVIWFGVASPFQEFFFRAWLQTRLIQTIGAWPALLLATGLFTVWHYVAPLNTVAVPLDTVQGLLGTFLAGFVYGIAFQRTTSVVTPWVAHAIAGMAFVFIGAIDFVAEFARFWPF